MGVRLRLRKVKNVDFLVKKLKGPSLASSYWRFPAYGRCNLPEFQLYIFCLFKDMPILRYIVPLTHKQSKNVHPGHDRPVYTYFK